MNFSSLNLKPLQKLICTVQCVWLLNKQLHILYSLVLNDWTFCTVYYDYNCVQKLGPLGTLSTLQTLKSPVPWLPEKRRQYIYKIISMYSFLWPSVTPHTSMTYIWDWQPTPSCSVVSPSPAHECSPQSRCSQDPHSTRYITSWLFPGPGHPPGGHEVW